MISKETKMSELIHADVHVLSVLHRLNIPLGFGDESVLEVCNNNKIHPDMFVSMVNLFMFDIVPQGNNLAIIPQLVQYLRLTHKYYLSHYLPLIEEHVQQLLIHEPQRSQDVQLISLFFEKYKTEFFLHLENEDNNVFPYVEKLFAAYVSEHAEDDFLQFVATSPIVGFEKDHDDLEEKLNDLKNIIIKYVFPFESVYHVHQVLLLLFELEKDVNQHARLEDLLMVPLVEKIENDVLRKFRPNHG